MKKRKLIGLIGVVLISLTVSYLSFGLVGSTTPHYQPTPSELCMGPVAGEPREVSYSSGFPFVISGRATIEVVCNMPGSYTPDRPTLLTSWQLYANAAVYATGIVGIAAVLLKLKKKPPERLF